MNKYDCFLALKTLNEWANEWEEVSCLKEQVKLYKIIIRYLLKKINISKIYIEPSIRDILCNEHLMPICKERVECPNCHKEITIVPVVLSNKCPFCGKTYPMEYNYENC